VSLDRLIESAGTSDLGLAQLAPKMTIIGCGGGGSNSIHRLRRLGVKGIETAALNTDYYHLAGIDADSRLLLGSTITKGFGTGGDPHLAEKCAYAELDKLVELVRGRDLVFVTAGLGGGTGSGIAPIVAELAKRQRAVVIGIVTMPFQIERGRLATAREGLERLRASAHSTIILDNNRLLDIVPKLPVEQAFVVMDQLIAEVIQEVTQTLCVPSMLNLDFADFRSLMLRGGSATVLYGEHIEPGQVVQDALSNPLLDVDISGATGALVHVTGGPRLSLRRAYEVYAGLTSRLHESAMVKVGARIDPDPERGDTISLMAIITGIETPYQAEPRAAQASGGLSGDELFGASPFDLALARSQ